MAESSDTRELGLCVARLQIDGEAISLDREELGEQGWQGTEFVNGSIARRWTTGETPLATGSRVVVAHLAGEGYYWRRSNDWRTRRLFVPAPTARWPDYYTTMSEMVKCAVGRNLTSFESRVI